ncbi:alpha/beta hydrolase [Duganella sp. LX20W]|uniref:Alpha/beta hydrolase n=1 Tax=Rugamonas brunnea TaxID=2758569 RepID=A0A7W2EV24_9BURK|nr:alpha/beta hydrolase [Rugamonas brunnea]MBA5639142.1 alpha/beta hydrolase [Rugamonas brunnea]
MASWVLLRGLMREQRHWGDFPAQLARALPGAAIITPDLPGNGSRHAEASPTSVDAMVEACRAQLRADGVAPPYRLLALSLGGMAAVAWADRYPDEVAACVLVNTSMRPYSRFHQRLRWHNYPAIAGLLLRGGVARQESLILRLTSRDAHVDDGLLQRWLAYQHDHPVSRVNALRQLWAAARFRAPSRRPDVPVLILSSAGDRLVSPSCSQRLARAWAAPHQVHPDAGHDLPLDDGPWVAHAVGQWLGMQSAQSAQSAQPAQSAHAAHAAHSAQSAQSAPGPVHQAGQTQSRVK